MQDLLHSLAMVRAGGALAPKNTLLNLEIIKLTRQIFDSGWRSVLTERQPRTSGVEHAHCFIGQLPARQDNDAKA